MIDLVVKIWPLLVAAVAAAAWGIGLAYRIASAVSRIESDVKHQVQQVADHEIRLRSLEDARVRHSVALESL